MQSGGGGCHSLRSLVSPTSRLLLYTRSRHGSPSKEVGTCNSLGSCSSQMKPVSRPARFHIRMYSSFHLIYFCLANDGVHTLQSKKSQEGINTRLALVMKSGKFTLGTKTCLKCLRSGKGLQTSPWSCCSVCEEC